MHTEPGNGNGPVFYYGELDGPWLALSQNQLIATKSNPIFHLLQNQDNLMTLDKIPGGDLFEKKKM